ncbi:hypothetical protein FOL47_004074 [Perkinsus chesapeaki]|uniref:UDP-N-acetylglucosamine transporter n=1 Tax=Perkinsus chesapeaki TaxID=330153 RepID=A0A7J6M4G5_PERCH|nr:hypothetical protein FOL47_004074 [Perkinsus chesapeaki]
MALPESKEHPPSVPLPVAILLYVLLCSLLAIINTFIHYEQRENHTFYGTNKFIVVTLAEAMKLLLCVLLYLAMSRRASPDPPSEYGLVTIVRYKSLKEALAYCVPAVVYLIENNSLFVALDLLDSSATFQLLLNVKIVITALLFRFFLGRDLSAAQFAFTVLCSIGLCVAVVSSGSEGETEGTGESQWLRTLMGAAIVLVVSLLASFSNIWVEYLFQDRDSDIPFLVRNSRIYMWGAPLNSIAVVGAAIVTGEMPTIAAFKAAHVTAAGLTVVGLATATILNYGNNMINAYLNAGTLILTVAVSALLFSDYSKVKSPWFLLGAVLVSVSAIGYRMAARGPTSVGQPTARKYARVDGKVDRLSTIDEASDEESAISEAE